MLPEDDTDGTTPKSAWPYLPREWSPPLAKESQQEVRTPRIWAQLPHSGVGDWGPPAGYQDLDRKLDRVLEELGELKRLYRQPVQWFPPDPQQQLPLFPRSHYSWMRPNILFPRVTCTAMVQ